MEGSALGEPACAPVVAVTATVVLAVPRGPLTDLDATGDTARTHRAFRDFLATIDNA